MSVKKNIEWHKQKLEQLNISIEDDKDQLAVLNQIISRKVTQYDSYKNKIEIAEQKGLTEFDINSKEI